MPHSPAPWTINSLTGEVAAADGTVIIHTEDGFQPERDDALLVHAAPDLLKAIIDALPVLRDQAHRFPAPEWDNMNRAFREAVAKATVKT